MATKIQQDQTQYTSSIYSGKSRSEKLAQEKQDNKASAPAGGKVPKAAQKADQSPQFVYNDQKKKLEEMIEDIINKYEKGKIKNLTNSLKASVDGLLDQVTSDKNLKAQLSAQIKQNIDEAQKQSTGSGDSGDSQIHNFFMILFSFLEKNVDANNEQMMGGFNHMQAQQKNFSNTETTLTDVQNSTQKKISDEQSKFGLIMGLVMGLLAIIAAVFTCGAGAAVMGAAEGAAAGATDAAVTAGADAGATAGADAGAAGATEATATTAEGAVSALGAMADDGATAAPEMIEMTDLSSTTSTEVTEITAEAEEAATPAADTAESSASNTEKSFLSRFFGETKTAIGTRLFTALTIIGGTMGGAYSGINQSTLQNESADLAYQQSTGAIYGNISDQTQIELQKTMQIDITNTTSNNQNVATVANQAVTLMGTVDSISSRG